MAYIYLEKRLLFLKVWIDTLKVKRSMALTHLMFAIRAKIKYKFVICRRIGTTIDIRNQKYIQKHLKFFGGTKVF